MHKFRLKYIFCSVLFLLFIKNSYCANCITSQPGNQTICIGGSAIFTIVAGSANSFQWQFKNGAIWGNVTTGTPTGANYTNGTTSSMTVNGISVVGAYQYKCLVSGGGCTDTSSIWVTLTVVADPSSPSAAKSPNTATVCAGQILTLTGVTNGSGGTGTCNIEYSNNGGTYTTTLTPFAATVGTNTISIRQNCNGSGCGLSSVTTFSWIVVADPSAPTATPSPNTANVCSGQILSLTGVTDNGGGTGTCNIEYSNNGGTFSTTLTPITASVGTNTITIRKNCNGSGCDISSTNTYSWTVVADPSAPTATKSPNVLNVCVGQLLTLTGVTDNGGGTGTCNFEYSINGGSYSTTLTPFAATLGTNTIAIRKNCNGSGCDISSVNTYSWTVVADPSAPSGTQIPSTTTVCEGQLLSLNVTDNGGGTGTCNIEYSVNGGAFSISNPSFPATLGTNTIAIRKNCNGSGCDISPTNTYTWNALPAPTPIVSNGTSICSGTSANIFAAGGVSFVWSPTSTLNFPYISNPVATPLVNTTYTVTVTGSNGCTASSTILVNVNPLPTANAGSNLSICSGSSTTLNGGGGISYNWLPSAGLSNPAIANPVANPVATATYTLTVTDNNNCSNTDNVTVSVNPLPIANAGSDVSICIGANTTLNASGGVAFHWLPITGLSNVNIANPIANPIVTTNYTVTVTDANSCINSDIITVSVNPLPMANAGSNISICSGTSATLNASGGIYYSWLPITGLSNSSASNTMANPTTTTNYTVTVTDINNCSNSDNVTITVNSLPSANAGNDTSICFGASATLNASGGISYSWLPSTGISNPNIANPNVSITTITTYTVTVTDANNCSNSDNVTISVNPLPAVNAGSDVSICIGGNTILNATGGSIYNWFPTTNLSNPNISNPVASPVVPVTYSVTATDINGCSGTDAVNVSINQSPTPNITGSSLVCQNAYWESYSTSSTTNNYLWSVNNGNIMSGQHTNSILVHWLTGTSGSINLVESLWATGCSSTDSLNVSFTTTTAIDTLDAPVILKPGSTNILECLDSVVQYNWGYENKITRIPVFTFTYTQYCVFPLFDPSNNYYWCIVSNGNGCETKSYYNTPGIVFNVGEVTSLNSAIIYPNPADNNFEVELNLENSQKQISISLYNSIGQKVLADSFENTTKGKTKKSIDVQLLKSGIYFLQLKLEDGTTTNKKVVIQK